MNEKNNPGDHCHPVPPSESLKWVVLALFCLAIWIAGVHAKTQRLNRELKHAEATQGFLEAEILRLMHRADTVETSAGIDTSRTVWHSGEPMVWKKHQGKWILERQIFPNANEEVKEEGPTQ